MGSTLQENCKAVYTYVNPSLECFTSVIFVTLFVTFHDYITFHTLFKASLKCSECGRYTSFVHHSLDKPETKS